MSAANYRPGGPVFLWDIGEANAATSALWRLQSSTSVFPQLLEQFGGIGIIWEHRFYGNSSPYYIDSDTPAEAFRYLTTQQALADIPVFAATFSRLDIDADLTPRGTPWVMIGGSYPGMRAAFMRDFYPDTIYAAYAASAPVQASVDMSFYWDPIWAGLNAKGFANCTADIHASILEIDALLSSPDTAAALKRQFLGRNATHNSNAAFADALTTIFNLWLAYGVEGGPRGLRFFCDWLSTDPLSNTTSPAAGWAPSRGANYTIARWAAWPFSMSAVNNGMSTACEGPGRTGAQLPWCDLERLVTHPDGIAWRWQACTEWGFFQTANLGARQLVSRFRDLAYQRYQCRRQFPDGVATGLLPEWPRVEETNSLFGGWSVRPARTYWSGGEFDPWRTLSPLSGEEWAPEVGISQEMPGCGDKYVGSSGRF